MKKFFILMSMLVIALVSLNSCQLQSEEVAPKISMNENFIPKESYSDAYPGYSNGSMPIGGAAYYIAIEKIGGDNVMRYYPIWINPKTGKPFNEMGKVFYNPKEESFQISFGENADVTRFGTLEDFKEKLNNKIENKGPNIVGSNRGSLGPSGFFFIVD